MGFFDKEMAKETVTQGTEHNTLASGTKVVGEIYADNDFRIDGEVEGSVNCKGKVVLGTKGLIKGSLTCSNAEISGSINGKLFVSEKLSLRSSARIEGEVHTKILNVEDNAKFSGIVDMAGVAKQPQPNQPTSAK